MNILEKNIQYLWRKRTLDGETWLCLYSFRSNNIHIRFVQGNTAGLYFVSCSAPRFYLKGFNLRQLLIMAFVELQKLTNDPYHKSTIRRVLAFFDTLKAEPELMSD